MGKIIYNKLVRDRIPEIIFSNGQKPVFRELTDREYGSMLDKKLFEEMEEYKDSGNIEELADIAEVLYAILAHRGFSIKDFEILREKKTIERGAFKNKVFLESVEE